MSSLSTSIYGSSTNKGVGGLLSGLDTDDLVKQMTATTRNKINRQFQAKQKLLYRQEAYREISTKLLTFSNKYFSYSSGSKTNILSPSFFKSYTFDSSSNYVNVSGNADNIKNFSINSISSVATAASFTSNKEVANEVFMSSEITKYTSSLAGETFSLNYEGTTHNFTVSEEFGKGILLNENERVVYFGDTVKELNKQLATMKDTNGNLINANNEKLKYILTGDPILGYKIELDQNIGTATLTAASTDIINALDMEVGKIASSQSTLTVSDLTRTAKDVMLDGSMAFDFNGVAKTISLSGMKEMKADSSYYTYDAAGLSSYLQKELNDSYGFGKVTVGFIDNKLTFKSNSESDIFGVSNISKELSYFTGIESGDYNRVNKTKALKDLGLTGLEAKDSYQININGETIDIENTMSITDIINRINSNAKAGVKVYYSSTTNTFSVKATETGTHKGISITDVDGNGNLASTLFGTGVEINNLIKPGTDTTMTYTLNGVQNTITRSTANFTIDEINVELNEKATTIDFTNNVTFDVTNNADEVVEKVKEFVDAYNEIINLIGTKTSEKPKRDYAPITPEQQEDMEEDEIKSWNEEAKKGVLFGDRNMTTVIRRMRETMSGLTDVSSITLSSIGISSASMDTSGKLILDEKKFKEKLLENPDEIANLFTGASSNTGTNAKSGIALQLQSMLRDNVGTYGTTGILIDEAGMSNSMTSDRNYISEKIEQYDDKMAELKDDLEIERRRYWDQFSALESSLNKLNSQSSWLTDMMGQ